MDYLDQYQIVLREIEENLSLENKILLVDNGKTRVFSCGQYDSVTLNRIVPIGIKKPSSPDSWDPRFRAIAELSIIRSIAQYLPELIDKLPLFYGLAVNERNEDLFIITEDFSQGGVHRVVDITDVLKDPIREVAELSLIKDLIDNPEADLDFDLARSCFLVNGKIRFGDFLHLRLYIKPEDRLFGKFGIYDIERTLDRFTIHV